MANFAELAQQLGFDANGIRSVGGPQLPTALPQLPTALPGIPTTPIPYGFGGITPRALGGSINLSNVASNFLPAGVPRGLGAVPADMAQYAAGGFDDIMAGFTHHLPAGASSPLEGILTHGGLRGTPVSIGGRAGAGFDAAALAKLGGPSAEALEGGLLSAGKGLIRNPMAAGGIKGLAKASVVPLIASVALNKAGDTAGGDNSFLGRFLKGAGTGATAGIFGPEAGVIGALGMGLFAGLTGGKKDGTPVWLKDEVLNRAGFDDQDKAQIQMTYDILKETEGKDKANAAIGQLIMQDITTRQQQRQEDEASQRRMLATQAITAKYFQPFTQQMMDSAQQRYQVSESVAADLPPEFRSVMRANNVAALDNAKNVAGAYATQAQLIPMMANVDYQRGLASQLSQMQAASVIQNMAGGGAGGGSLVDMLSQQAQAGTPGAGG